MSNSLCKTSVLRVYQEVIDDVIAGVTELFVEDGVEDQVLQELKHTWETKLMASKAVQNEEETKQQVVNTTNGFPKQQIVQQQIVQQQNQQIVQQQPMIPQQVPQQPQSAQQVVVETKMVPIQITLPPQPGSDGSQRVLTIQVPSTALQGNQLQKVLTGPVITATMGLPVNIASSLLQQHVNAAFSSQQHSLAIVKQNVVQTDGACDEQAHCSSQPTAQTSGHALSSAHIDAQMDTQLLTDLENDRLLEIEIIMPKSRKTKHLRQTDGPVDTSDEDEDGSDNDEDDDDDLDDDKDENDEMEDEAGEEEPLNSEDDVTDDDPTDLFDTDNIVVCQYDKIIRNRNKWKFYLKDGIMNLSSQDYVFQKANGDAEW